MIVVPIMGGLGNQMFQYAFGRAMTTELDRRLILDVTMMPTGRPPHLRDYELPRLPIAPSTRAVGAPDPDAAVLTSRPRIGRLVRALRRRTGRSFVREPEEGTLLRPEDVPHRLAVCFGYWQSHQYFARIASEVRRELMPRVDTTGPVARLLDEVEGTEPIAVHVRRGDYATDAKISSIHGLQGADYYRDAVTSIVRAVNGPVTAVVLSDDPTWAAENLRLDVPAVHAEAAAPLTTIDSLALMSRCAHHVIANSSFSWWGAWLAEHDGQQVVRPRRWFATRKVDEHARFPAHWRTAS